MAALAAVIAVTTMPSAPPAPRDPLLVAAESAAGERPGKWWVVDTAQGFPDGSRGGSRRLGPLAPGRQYPLARTDPLFKIMVTTTELASAPTDPAQLRDWLTERIRRVGGEPSGHLLFWAGESLVMDLPVTPQLRATAYRMLAGLDGVRSIGQATDQFGRTGSAVAFDYAGRRYPYDPDSPVGPMQARLIIDLPSGRALASESYSRTDGTLRFWTAALNSYYTDTPPTSDEPIEATPR